MQSNNKKSKLKLKIRNVKQQK